MFELARAYRDEGMTAYSRLQQAEFASEPHGYSATRHQREVGTGYFDDVANVIAAGAGLDDGAGGLDGAARSSDVPLTECRSPLRRGVRWTTPRRSGPPTRRRHPLDRPRRRRRLFDGRSAEAPPATYPDESGGPVATSRDLGLRPQDEAAPRRAVRPLREDPLDLPLRRRRGRLGRRPRRARRGRTSSG